MNIYTPFIYPYEYGPVSRILYGYINQSKKYIHTCVGKRLTCNPHVAIKRPRTRQEPTNKTRAHEQDKSLWTSLTCNPHVAIKDLVRAIPRTRSEDSRAIPQTRSTLRVMIKRPRTRSVAVRHWHDLGSCSWALYCSCHASGLRSP